MPAIRWLATLLTLTALSVATAEASCCGDCNGDGQVTIDDTLTAVDGLLHGCASTPCCGDCDGNGAVHVDEIIRTVRSALTACGRDGLCGGPLLSTPQLCHFRAVPNPAELPNVLRFEWDWSDAENDINLFCVGLQQIGYDPAPWTECTTDWRFPLPVRSNGQAIIYVRSPWLPMKIAPTIGVSLNGPASTSDKALSTVASRTILVTFQVGDAGGHMSNIVQTQLRLIR